MRFSGNIITSRQNPLAVTLCKLDDRKTRKALGLFRFDGVKLFCEAILKGIEIEKIIIKESVCEKVISRADELLGADVSSSELEYTLFSDELFDRVCEENAPDGIICIARLPKNIHGEACLADGGALCVGEGERIILLESVRDPQNVGAIIRSAVAFGIDRLIISRDCADLYNQKAVRGSMGTLFGIRIDRVDNISLAVSALRAQGRRVFASALDERARALGEVILGDRDCVLIGNEGHGLTQQAIASCDEKLYIPMNAGAESLNAAVAASVFMWEMRKR